MTYNYLWLVNRLCQKLNEVELDSSTFADANGVYADFKAAVNAAIGDICQIQDNQWPFNWVNTTFTTTIGVNEYNNHANALNVEWESFKIKRQPLTVASITQTAGTAIATVSAGHQLITGDTVYISGANQSDYVGNFNVVVTSSTQFTFSVSSSATSPATGTIILYPPYPTKKLTLIDYDAYGEEGWEEYDDNMIQTGQYNVPKLVVRKLDNNFIISPKPDRIYTVSYGYFTSPDDLVLYNDVPVIPETWKETIVKVAIYQAYMFRDNLEEAVKAEKDFTDDIVSMRRILIPQQTFMRAID